MLVANIVLRALAALEMDPHGVFTGMVGAMLSLFVVNGNDFTWRRTALTLMAGLGVCGYTLPWVETMVDERSLAQVANIGISYLLSDLLSSVKTKAPTITNWMVDALMGFLRRFTSPPNPPAR